MSQIIKSQNPVINWGHPLAKGLIFDTPFTERGGLKTKDIAQNVQGSFQSTVPTWGNDIYGSVLNFGGAGNINFGLPAGIQALNKLTVSALVNLADNNTRRDIMGQWITGVPKYHFLLTYGVAVANFQVYISTTGSDAITTVGTTTPTVGKWYLVTATNDNSNLTIYVNGVQEGQNAQTSALVSGATDNLYVGQSGDGSPFNGKIALTRIWNRALSSNEVKSLYINPFAIYQQPAFAYANSIASYFNDMLIMFR